MPPENELKARVDFIYSDQDYERDADKFWKKEGKKRNGRLEAFVGKPGDVAGVVAQTVSPNDPPEVKLHKLYDRVLHEIERPLILLSLEATRGNQMKAADLLGLNRNTLRKKIRDLDIQVIRSIR